MKHDIHIRADTKEQTLAKHKMRNTKKITINELKNRNTRFHKLSMDKETYLSEKPITKSLTNLKKSRGENHNNKYNRVQDRNIIPVSQRFGSERE